MRQILLFSALAASLALLIGCGAAKDKPEAAKDMPDKAAYHKISAEEAYEMIASQEVVVVDVRTREEYDGGHIENAVLVPNESIGSEMPEALPDKEATLLALRSTCQAYFVEWRELLRYAQIAGVIFRNVLR